MTAMKRILVPIDFSPTSRAALGHALELRSGLGSAVSVLHVHEPSGFVGTDSLAFMPLDRPSRRWELMRAELVHEIEHFLGAERPSIEDVRVEAGVPADVIPEVAREGGFDLILMGTHGQGPISRLALGDVAEGVMRKAHCLVMTLRLPIRPGRETVCM